MYKRILFPVDLNHPEAAEKAMGTARQIAKDYGAQLHLLNVLPPIDSFASSYLPDDYAQSMAKGALERLHAYSAAQDLGDLKVQHIVSQGVVYDQILKTAEKANIDLIVMASHRPELSDYLLGPNAARVVRHADCSVMVVRN